MLCAGGTAQRVGSALNPAEPTTSNIFRASQDPVEVQFSPGLYAGRN
jgi:hypothetical protein